MNLTTILIAYLDPGSGSLIIQVIIATLAGVGFIIRSNWQKIKGLFSKNTEDEIEE
jgi:hypothetical protein